MAVQLDLSAGLGASLEVGSEHKNTKSTNSIQQQKAQMQKLDDARPSTSSRRDIVMRSNCKEPA